VLNLPITSLFFRKLEAQPLLLHVTAKAVIEIILLAALYCWVTDPFQLAKFKYNQTIKKLLKLIYCLGSFLRGNRQAQIHFGAAGGPIVLGKAMEIAIQNAHEANAFYNKMAVRLFNLASDIVADVTLHPFDGKHKSVDDAIIQAYSSKEWCAAVVAALQVVGIEETALKTVLTLAPYCQFDADAIHLAIAKIKKAWESSDMDPDVHKNLVELADSTKQALQNSIGS